MPRIRDPNRDKAFEVYKQHKGNIDLVEIANQLSVPPGTVRGWKAKDKWEYQLNGTLPKNIERSKRSNGNNSNNKTNNKNNSKARGAPKGNKNAVGNNGGAPEGNLNPIKHGAYQNIYKDALPEDERAIYDIADESANLDNEIKLVRLKIARLLNREKTFFYDMFGKKRVIDIKEEDREQGIVICINQLEKLVKTKAAIMNDTAKFEYQKQKDEIEIEIKLARLELDKAKSNMDDETEVEDDGFLDALAAEVENVWED